MKKLHSYEKGTFPVIAQTNPRYSIQYIYKLKRPENCRSLTHDISQVAILQTICEFLMKFQQFNLHMIQARWGGGKGTKAKTAWVDVRCRAMN